MNLGCGTGDIAYSGRDSPRVALGGESAWVWQQSVCREQQKMSCRLENQAGGNPPETIQQPRVLPPVVSWAGCVWPGLRSKDSVQRSKRLFCFHMLCVMKRELISLRHSGPAAFTVKHLNVCITGRLHFLRCIFCTIKLEINWISS